MELTLKAVLKDEAKKSIKEKRITWSGGKCYEDAYFIGHTRVQVNQGIAYAVVNRPEPIPKEIEEFIIAFKVEGTLDHRIIGKRLRGKYALLGDGGFY